MLVYSKERFYPTLINTLVLEDKGGGFWYVHRSVYDQALILSAKQTADGIIILMDSEHNEDAVRFWFENAPSPLNILAPFFGLVTGELPLDIEVLAGVMHVITSQIDVYNLIKQKKEHRQTVKLSLSVLNEYAMSWDSFKAQCTKPNFQTPLFAGIPFGAAMTPDYTPVPEVDYGTSKENTAEVSIEGSPEGEVLDITIEDLKKDPNWQDLGFGTWYNAVLDQSLCFEEDEADYEKEFEGMMNANLQAMGASIEEEKEEAPQETLRKKLVKLGG